MSLLLLAIVFETMFSTGIDAYYEYNYKDKLEKVRAHVERVCERRETVVQFT